MYLIDIGTQNPDSVSSTFVSLLAQAPFLSASARLAWSIFAAAMIGTFAGTIIQVICYTEDAVANSWLLLLRVPWAVSFTWYFIFLIDRYDPDTTASATFSALYVQIATVRTPTVLVPNCELTRNSLPLTCSMNGLPWQRSFLTKAEMCLSTHSSSESWPF